MQDNDDEKLTHCFLDDEELSAEDASVEGGVDE